MPTNVNPTVSPSIQQTSRTSEAKTDRISVTRDGGSGSGFVKQTDVRLSTSVDNMSAVLDKVASNKLEGGEALPKQLQQMINNVLRSAFSLDSTLSNGLGSSIASERYSIEQLTTLARIFQQLANYANSDVSSAEAAGQPPAEIMAGELSDNLQALMANIKSTLIRAGLVDDSGNLELVRLNKLAFQFLNDGNADKLPADFVALLQALSTQSMGVSQASNLANEETSALKQIIEALFPKPITTSNANAGQSGQAGANAGQAGQNVVGQNAQTAMSQSNTAQAGTGQTVAQANAGQGASTANLQGGATANSQAGANANASMQSQGVQGQPVNAQNAQANAGGQNAQGGAEQATSPNVANNAANANSAANANTNAMSNANNANSSGTTNTANVNQQGVQNQEGNVQQQANAGQASQSHQQVASGSDTMRQAAEIENNPIFKQIFSRYGYSQETGVVKNTNAQQELPAQLTNNQQTTAVFKNLAQLVLKDSNLTAKDAQLLQDFVNGKEVLSQQDAKQLNLLLRMVQRNVPTAVQQAGQQQGMDGLPKLWAFLQLAELGTLKNIKAKDLKNARKEIKTMVSSMKGAITSEGSYKANGQKAISFVMPLYIGENEQSYPAYVHIYDEPPYEDELKRIRKDTWFRVCVLTENIGAVDIVCQLFEGNNLNLRVKFSDQDSVKEFSEFLPDIRKALYNSSIHLNDFKVGTVN